MKEIDDVIEEIRAGRCRISEECGHDIRRLIRYLQDFERRHADQIRRWEGARGPAPVSHSEER